MIVVALARDEEVIGMHEHRDLRTIGILLVEHAWFIRVDDESIISRRIA